MVKIVDLLAQQKKKEESSFVSYEYFPPKTPKGVENLTRRIDQMAKSQPLFVDFTWGAGGSTAELTLDLTVEAKQRGYEPNMHLTCTNMKMATLEKTLEVCIAESIHNLVALRGDPPLDNKNNQKEQEQDNELTCALDLVQFIRKKTNDFFCISVAGYPEGHPGSLSKVSPGEVLSSSEQARQVLSPEDNCVYVCRDADFKKELLYLKAKIDAGADLILTQMFFDAEVYFSFVAQCRQIGINVPIIPGIMCISSYKGFQRMTDFCKSRVPPKMRQRMELVKDDEQEFKKLGIKLGIELCQQLLDSPKYAPPGLHFYTLNQNATVDAIRKGLTL